MNRKKFVITLIIVIVAAVACCVAIRDKNWSGKTSDSATSTNQVLKEDLAISELAKRNI
jgi:hypothetical protein